VVVYETEDSDFVDSAIEALKKANIDCYRTGVSLQGFIGDGTSVARSCGQFRFPLD
jgi:hypothetical protein